jgi:hypothetical protein
MLNKSSLKQKYKPFPAFSVTMFDMNKTEWNYLTLLVSTAWTILICSTTPGDLGGGGISKVLTLFFFICRVLVQK